MALQRSHILIGGAISIILLLLINQQKENIFSCQCSEATTVEKSIVQPSQISLCRKGHQFTSIWFVGLKTPTGTARVESWDDRVINATRENYPNARIFVMESNKISSKTIISNIQLRVAEFEPLADNSIKKGPVWYDLRKDSAHFLKHRPDFVFVLNKDRILYLIEEVIPWLLDPLKSVRVLFMKDPVKKFDTHQRVDLIFQKKDILKTIPKGEVAVYEKWLGSQQKKDDIILISGNITHKSEHMNIIKKLDPRRLQRLKLTLVFLGDRDKESYETLKQKMISQKISYAFLDKIRKEKLIELYVRANAFIVAGEGSAPDQVNEAIFAGTPYILSRNIEIDSSLENFGLRVEPDFSDINQALDELFSKNWPNVFSEFPRYQLSEEVYFNWLFSRIEAGYCGLFSQFCQMKCSDTI